MEVIIGYILAVLVGLSMGIMGGGGSILSVPIFVYIIGMNAQDATSGSLFVVGATSLIGVFIHFRKKNIELTKALLFGIPSLLGVIVVRQFILPALPNTIIDTNLFILTKDKFILILFAIIMLLASFKMIQKTKLSVESTKSSSTTTIALVIQGLIIGMITGMIGAGGGFMIVPALVLLLKMDVKKAIATSIFIIALNSLLGFATTQNVSEHFNWTFILIFTAISMLSLIIGTRIAQKVNSKKLKPAFGWFVLVTGCLIIIKELAF